MRDYGLISPLSIPKTSSVPAPETRSSNTAEYDHYFRIIRHDSGLLDWSRTCLRVEGQLLEDLEQTSLSAEDKYRVLQGLLTVHHVTLERWVAVEEASPSGEQAGSPGAAEASELLPTQRDAVRRWKLGHHIFHILLVVMNTKLDDILELLGHQDWDAATAALSDLARLYEAATSSMRYTSDFGRLQYEGLIRPSMMPPFASPGFSGVFNVEHAVMRDRLKRLRAAMRSLERLAPERTLAAWEQLQDAERANCDSHALICHKFVDDGVSLLRDFFRQRKEPRRE